MSKKEIKKLLLKKYTQLEKEFLSEAEKTKQFREYCAEIIRYNRKF